MKTRDRPYFSKKLVRTTTISVVLLIAAIMVISAIPTMATPVKSTKMNKLDEKEMIQGDPTGLDPKIMESKLAANSLMTSMEQPFGPLSDDEMFYCCDALDFDVVKWPLDGSGSEEVIASGQNLYFLAGGDWTCDEIWYGCEYNTGGLWTIDPDTGDMEQIGGGGTSCNGLAWDPMYNRLYGAGSTALYEYDPETGEQTQIGSGFGIANSMICMFIDMDGQAWGYDVLFTGNAHLYTIDLEAGTAEDYCDMGENLLYAQDGAYDRDTNTVYIAGYSSGGFYGYWDWDNQEIVHYGTLNSEYACAMVRSPCIPPEHDVGVKAILKPTQSGHAVPSMDMELLVKNYGANPEVFDAQMEIIKCEESGNFLLQEDFSGGVLPENWTTDYWKIQYSNYASGTSPEAMCYKYDQYYGGQYYDNYIMTPGFDATGWEKLSMTFRMAFEVYSSYGQYCNFYVKWRPNDTSSWKDVSPWDNPMGSSYEGDYYEIGCYGFGSELGDGFQIMFQYIGYYYYYNNIYIDDISVEGCGGCAEYAELEEDISLGPGEETTVVFPGWQPSEWQNESYQDDWEEYPVHGFTIFDGDQQPRNNDKWILLQLYYPFFYDIEITEIGSPSEGRSIPAQTFDVEATITNVGQFPACCIGIDMSIGAPQVLDTMVSEYDWPGVTNPMGSSYQTYYPGYDDGWRDEHKSITYYYGWQRYNNQYAGGEPYEAYIPYYYAYADYVFMSGPFDSSDYPSLQLNFLTYINHYSGSGLYALEAGYSHDGETWYAAWHEEPSASGGYEVEVPIEGGSETTYIGFWAKGDPYYFNYWYLDNVEVKAVGLETEWTDFMCQGDDLEPGQSRVFNFDPWTPAFLAEETTAWGVPYKAEATIDVEVDQDPGNNIKVNDFDLDYWHDPALGPIQSPAIGRADDVLWENGEPDGRNGLAGSYYYGYSNILVDDFTLEADSHATGGDFSFIWNSGSGTGNLDTVDVYFFEETGDCEPSMDEYYVVDDATIVSEELTGASYFSRPEIVVTVEFEEVDLAAGQWWVGFQPDSVGEDLGYMLTAESKGCEIMADLPYWGYPRWSSSSYLWGSQYDLAWALYGFSSGPPGIKVYISAGTKSIDGIAVNQGTFQETGLTCSAEIWEYISEPDNGTQQYSDEITGIDLTTPLGGTVPLPFEDFTFAYEGRYGLFLSMPGEEGRDDFPKNNNIRYGVAVDGTDPVSDYALDPPTPDGENDWYVSDVEVTLTAYDPLSNDVSSGIDMMKYKIGDDPVQTINGAIGTFLITVLNDGEDVPVEYWAIDNVGNEESHHTFYIDMDQTVPEIDLAYEVISGNPIQGWVLEFTATATDVTSHMDRVEFFLNEGIQSTVPGAGPEYKWSFTYYQDISIDIRVDGYDIAGNMASDVVSDPTPTEYNVFNMQQQNVQTLQQ